MKAVSENLQFILPALHHGLSLIKNNPQASQPSSHIHASDKSAPSAPNSQPTESIFVHTCGSSHHNIPHTNPDTTRKSSPWPMISVDEALKIVLDKIAPLPVVQIPVSESLGHVIAEDVRAKDPLPPFRASIKDGYAVISDVNFVGICRFLSEL